MNSSEFRTPHFASEFGASGGVNNSMLPALAFALGGGLLYLSYFKSSKKLASLPSPGDVIIEEQKPVKSLNLEPSTNFHYATTPPIKFRPYRPTMGIHPITPNDLILLDSSYSRRLAYRRQLLRTHPTETYGHNPAATWAVSEYYTYMMSVHLPTRFPAHFSLSPSGTLVQNHTTTNTYPIIPQSAPNALRALGENLDEDFVFLLPGEDGGYYSVAAFVVCFPSRARKLGDTLPDFDHTDLGKLRPGVENAVQRVNWSIARNAELFTPAIEGEEQVEEQHEITAEECCLRVERQTLVKLPETGAVVLGIKTYMTPLSEIKKEDGEAEKLAEAIEARGGWEKAVVEYLRA